MIKYGLTHISHAAQHRILAHTENEGQHLIILGES